MNRNLLTVAFVAATIGASAARADVMNGSAAPKVPVFAARGATEVMILGGPLAPSLQGKPVVARIHADWCPACTATQATIDDLKAAYGSQINFVQFDVTNAKTAAAAEAEAKKLGLEKFFEAEKAATSTVAVIDPRDGKVYAQLYNDGNINDYKVAVNGALGVVNK
jgi:thiol-disulfide isomerase/thioredoxin